MKEYTAEELSYLRANINKYDNLIEFQKQNEPELSKLYCLIKKYNELKSENGDFQKIKERTYGYDTLDKQIKYLIAIFNDYEKTINEIGGYEEIEKLVKLARYHSFIFRKQCLKNKINKFLKTNKDITKLLNEFEKEEFIKKFKHGGKILSLLQWTGNNDLLVKHLEILKAKGIINFLNIQSVINGQETPSLISDNPIVDALCIFQVWEMIGAINNNIKSKQPNVRIIKLFDITSDEIRKAKDKHTTDGKFEHERISFFEKILKI